MKTEDLIYRRLLAQAEEAKEQGLVKLAEYITNAVEYEKSKSVTEYSYSQLNDDIQKDLWKVATHVIKYYDLKNVQAEKIQDAIAQSANQLILDLENVLSVDPSMTVSSEPLVPGENK